MICPAACAKQPLTYVGIIRHEDLNILRAVRVSIKNMRHILSDDVRMIVLLLLTMLISSNQYNNNKNNNDKIYVFMRIVSTL